MNAKPMRKLVAALVVAATLSVGAVVTSNPVDAHPIPSTEVNSICRYIRPPGSPIWAIATYRGIHYGEAHIAQCWYTRSGITRCRQYVYNIPSPYWSEWTVWPDPVGGVCW